MWVHIKPTFNIILTVALAHDTVDEQPQVAVRIK